MTMSSREKLFCELTDVVSWRRQLAQHGRVQIRPVLTGLAAQAVRLAVEKLPFRLSVNSGATCMDLALDELDKLNPEQAAQMTALIHTGARQGFQYCFDTYRLSDEVDADRLQQGALFELYRELNGEPMLRLFRELSGDPNIIFCDAQVTRYRPGQFLTSHDDDVSGKGRVLAFVLNLTERWSPDWGGLLLFHGEHGTIDGGFSPVFNALNVFSIPRQHAVSLVAPFAEGCRYSVTGWARNRI